MNILDIFYNHIVEEASNGRVDCFVYYNIFFETYIDETDTRITSLIQYDNTLVPTLYIKNKALFDALLQKYVELSLAFYDDNNFDEEIINRVDFEKNKTCKEKVIMTLLWSNATYDDFQNPIEFLRKRIAFLESNIGGISHEFEFSPILNGNISIDIEKDKIYNETPYQMIIKSTNPNDEIYTFPKIKFGIDNDTVYIYAIQNKEEPMVGYTKRVNRALYKVGEGFDKEKDNYELYDSGNLSDISPSFLVSLNMAISYFQSLGFTKIVVPSILISRWNAKKIGLSYLEQAGRITPETLHYRLEDQDRIQHNLTEKLLRTFLRLKYHYDNIDVDSLPFEGDSCLHMSINGELVGNNTLLNETASLVRMNKNRII